MSNLSPPRRPSPDDQLVLDARPAAIKLARTLAFIWGTRSLALVEDCEQAACEAQLLARPKFDKSRGTSFEVFQWKRVAGAVTRLLRREAAYGRTGFDDALNETDECKAEGDDPFSAEEHIDDMAKLKAWCRQLTLRRVLGDKRVALQAGPDSAAERAEIIRALRCALGELSERELQVIDLHHWQGLTWKEVGEQMGISDRHAKRIDERIRARLERDLRRQGVDEAPPSSVNV